MKIGRYHQRLLCFVAVSLLSVSEEDSICEGVGDGDSGSEKGQKKSSFPVQEQIQVNRLSSTVHTSPSQEVQSMSQG